LVAVIREVRTTYKIPPRQTVHCSAKASRELSDQVAPHVQLIETLANTRDMKIGPDVPRPGDAAASLTADLEVYVHGLVNRDEQCHRLRKRLAEVQRNIEALSRRLDNKGYVDRAPPHLVQQTRDQLDAAEMEARALKAQSASLA
jgi:valyl-tRNA synthetase